MGRLYADGKSKPLFTVVAESWSEDTTSRHGVEVDWLFNEHCVTLLIEGQVDLAGAAAAMQRESSGYEFPAPRHAWMRYMSAPEDEPVESGYGWRGECQRGEKGAEPVTIAVRNT
ncbi:hypothetical protein LL998_34030 (plasmid) [Burkholderia ambifaria]|uniref:hypothetical protein n=1 Tax=Burkholderia ambifaria TaxID=152480 RepID=UPI001E396494|nr:hypothetical protein [Burkholderia ambifaria]UEP39760.1 hypothetical protein LL998_34030 [Burkholderia ambifaria]